MERDLLEYFPVSTGTETETTTATVTAARSPWLGEWVSNHFNNCWNCGKPFTTNNRPFGQHLAKKGITAFRHTCTRCSVRQILDYHNLPYYQGELPVAVRLARRLA